MGASAFWIFLLIYCSKETIYIIHYIYPYLWIPENVLRYQRVSYIIFTVEKSNRSRAISNPTRLLLFNLPTPKKVCIQTVLFIHHIPYRHTSRGFHIPILRASIHKLVQCDGLIFKSAIDANLSSTQMNQDRTNTIEEIKELIMRTRVFRSV